MIQFEEDKQNVKLKDLRKQEEEEVTQMLGRRLGIPYVNFSYTPINMDALRVIPERQSRDAKVVAYNVVNKSLDVAVISPESDTAKALLEELKQRGYEPKISVASMESLNRGWEFYHDLSFAAETKAGSLEISNDEIREIISKVKTKDDIKKLITDVLALQKGFRISKILEIILAGALATAASDIHIEPEEAYIRLRYRLDGVLNTILTFDTDTYNLLLSRVKLLSGLKLNIKDDAQDGRFSVKIDELSIEIRTSILPGAYNESIVMRILNPKNISVPLEELGINPKLLKVLQTEIAKPEGMILTTGPTGSGKTTTLYAFLKTIHTPDIKIITIEDPIEYHLPGVVQTQTDDEKGYTFLNGLRSALRQDPDVIMVGEIRDNETAEIAVNSALTGHLVFSTLHTNNAAGTFPRLIDLGVNPKVITSAINVAMAQRLVRRLCNDCRKEVVLEGKEKELVERILASIADRSYLEGVTTERMWIAGECDKCNHTGYKGRVGLYEAIRTDEKIEEAILLNPSEREIKRAAHHQGILDMRQDGILKVVRGITSVAELRRVIDIDKEIQEDTAPEALEGAVTTMNEAEPLPPPEATAENSSATPS